MTDNTDDKQNSEEQVSPREHLDEFLFSQPSAPLSAHSPASIPQDVTIVIGDESSKELPGEQLAQPQFLEVRIPLPPTEKAKGIAIAAAGWQRDKRVIAMFAPAEERNSWIGIAGIGWKQIAFTSTTGTMALSMLATLAKQTGSRVDYREGDDGRIYEMYLL